MVKTIQFEEVASAAQRAAEALDRFGVGMQPMVRAVQVTNRRLARLRWSRGDHHMDRICKEIIAGVPGRDSAIRLSAAAGLAEVLDHIPERRRVR